MFTVGRHRPLQSVVLVLLVSGAITGNWTTSSGAEEPPAASKGIHMKCGTCPEGYVTTGVTEAPTMCKEGDPTLAQCTPLGVNMLAVCGACPEGYREIGSSSVPARCGNLDGGRLSQCQLQNMELTLPDPTQGGKMCPPDCGAMPEPGQGAMPPLPKFLPGPGEK